jgi:carbonic anhydrase/acetyltransferase-like protein (isoleucine patch superfamily)
VSAYRSATTDVPAVDPTAWIAPGATVVGDVTLGPSSSVWYGCVLRGDLAPIRIGAETNIQDLVLVHVDVDLPSLVGDRVTVGHHCVVHGCEVGDDALIGMGAVLLNGCRIGRGAVVAAGAVVREGFHVPDGALAVGVPAKIRGAVTPELRARMQEGVARYVEGAAEYRSGRRGGGPYGGRPPSRSNGKVT